MCSAAVCKHLYSLSYCFNNDSGILFWFSGDVFLIKFFFIDDVLFSDDILSLTGDEVIEVWVSFISEVWLELISKSCCSLEYFSINFVTQIISILIGKSDVNFLFLQ